VLVELAEVGRSTELDRAPMAAAAAAAAAASGERAAAAIGVLFGFDASITAPEEPIPKSSSSVACFDKRLLLALENDLGPLAKPLPKSWLLSSGAPPKEKPVLGTNFFAAT